MDNRPLAGRVRAPSRPLPADAQWWDCVVNSPDCNPFLPRILWTTEGYQGIIMLDPAPVNDITAPLEENEHRGDERQATTLDTIKDMPA